MDWALALSFGLLTLLLRLPYRLGVPYNMGCGPVRPRAQRVRRQQTPAPPAGVCALHPLRTSAEYVLPIGRKPVTYAAGYTFSRDAPPRRANAVPH